MRLKLTLHALDKYIPINYQYYLSAAIYKLLKFGSEEFATYLHDIGFQLNGKTYKLFSFAFQFDNYLANNKSFQLLKKEVILFITSPLIEEFLKNLIVGFFDNQTIEINDSFYRCRLQIQQVEILETPDFKEINYCKMLSPTVFSTKQETNDKLHQYYFRYYDDIEEINRVLNSNLKNKYKLIYKKDYVGEDLTLIWDEDYIKQKTKQGKRLTKKLSIPQPEGKSIEVIGNYLPFMLNGNKELIQVAYECGLGEKNSSLGCGMFEIQ